MTSPRLNRRAMLSAAAVVAGCRPRRGASSLVVYTSLDEPYSRPILNSFQETTGVTVRPLFDTEANKSRGLAARLAAERSRPRADVFWSSEVMQTVRLAEQGLLTRYDAPAAAAIPPRYRDPEGRWTGFGARFRVFAWDSDHAGEPPAGFEELLRPKWKGQIALARPLWGTTFTEACALFQLLGGTPARRFYEGLAQQDLRLVDGNSRTAELAADGVVAVGLTDTDDLFIRQPEHPNLHAVYPDQPSPGTILIPNTVGLVAGGPNPEAGRQFIDFLLQPETERRLAELPSRQLPLNPEARSTVPEPVQQLAQIAVAPVDYQDLAPLYDEVNRFLNNLFLE